jgi:phospholipid/cholesterol/gamma-HCH transport system permease protein
MNLILPETCSTESVAALWREVMPKLSELGKGEEVALDADGVVRCDGAGEALIVEIYRRSVRQGFSVSCRDARQIVSRTLGLFPVERFTEDPSMVNPIRNTHTREQLGQAVVRIYDDICEQLAFLGELTVSAFSLLVRPGRLRLRDTMLHFERAGIDALPITVLIGFLLGLILAFQSAAALRQFGVEVYVADLIAIGLFRELGPLITAIILAGRSGSAFAAEIGTMKVNEEIDALTTLSLPPIVFLALPRVIAATLVMPILSIFAVIAGLIGGVVVLGSVNVPASTYWQHVVAASSLSNIVLGLLKSAVFGLLVGLVGCSHGLQTGRTADAVGRAATAAVVGSLILITIFDGIFAVLFFLLGV